LQTIRKKVYPPGAGENTYYGRGHSIGFDG
jgi:hypothetical protein